MPGASNRLIEIGGRDSGLHKKHKAYLDAVTIATPPEGHDERLAPMFPGAWAHLRLYALEAHDLALSRLEPNFERDRGDARQLALAGRLKPEILR